MKAAPIPQDEKERLTELLSYELLDSDSEALFDELTELASVLCDVPIALVSLVDAERQWFKSKKGLDAAETPRNISFCGHAILQDELFEVADALNDPRFADNPLVTGDPNIRFYAGMPLTTPSGQAIGTVCVISDKPKTLTATQRKALASIRNTLIAHLELRRKNLALKRAEKIQSDFLSYVSHEIRTQLNGINSLSAILEREASQANMPLSFRETTQHIRKGGERLLDIVNSVLDIKTIEAGKMSLYPRAVFMPEFLAHLTVLAKSRAFDSGVNFIENIDTNLPSSLIFDDTKVGQIVLNLLGNAIKFTPASRDVTFTVSMSQNTLNIEVSDEGIGIKKDDLEKLFQPFTRSHHAASYAGTGLGLMITRSLIELMNGSISVQSKINVGTVVSVSIPVQKTEVPVSPIPQSHISSPDFNPNSKVVVVEDSEINQVVLSALFDRLSLPVTLVSDAEAAIGHLNTHPVDLLFLDLNLPGMSGKEAAMIVRNRFPDLPIIALTADGFETFPMISQFGFSDILTKPVNQQKMVDILNHYL